jgi:hypothetical protein
MTHRVLADCEPLVPRPTGIRRPWKAVVRGAGRLIRSTTSSLMVLWAAGPIGKVALVSVYFPLVLPLAFNRQSGLDVRADDSSMVPSVATEPS